MAQAFGDRLHERGAVRAWTEVLSDLIRSIPEQIMEVSLMNRFLMPLLAVVGGGLVVVAMVTGIGPPISLLFLGFGLLAGLLTLLNKRNHRSSEFSYGGLVPKRWTWWTVLATTLAVMYVVAATGQLIADPKGTNVGALGIACAFAALIGAGLFLRSRSRVGGNWMVAVAAIPALAFFWIIWPAVLALAIIFGAVKEISGPSPHAPAAA